MARIALLLSYDGSEFCGWQRQAGDRSVQEDLEKALSKLCGSPVSVTGSGRTDAGVHAIGQVAHFDDQEGNIPPDKFFLALNTHLPRDIRVHQSRAFDDDFHARYGAVRREYAYYLRNTAVLPAHLEPYRYAVRQPLSVQRLNALAQTLTGTHDFSTFAAAGDQSSTAVREIFQARFVQEGADMVFRIAGNAFLWRMVRSLTGTLVDLAKKGAGPEEMKNRLEACNRDAAGPTAPPKGLFLERVDYGPKYRFY